jgi:spermidine/putrescine transport system substrate-binding protein
MDNMGRYKAQSRSIIASYGDLTNQFVSGEIAATFAAWAAVNIWTGQQGVVTKAVVPKEGTSSWCDAWFLPKTAKNRDTALAWISDVVAPETQARMAKSLAGGVVNKKAVPLLDAETRGLYPYDAIDGYLQSSPFYGIPPRESDQYATFDDWLAAWQTFKA